MFDNDIGYANFDLGNIEQNAYDDGFGDGMEEVIGIMEGFKEKHKYNIGSQALLRELELYILKNKPRRNK